VVGLVTVCFALPASAGAAVATSSPDPGPSLQECQADPAHYGELPTCTYDENGKLIDTSYDSGAGDSGIAGTFVALFVLALAVGAGLTIWRVSLARSMATRAGLDPHEATAVTLLSPDGLDATYLAANLTANRPPPQQSVDPGHVIADLSGERAPAGTPASSRSTAERLRELDQLRDQGLITPAEHDTRRQAILDNI